MVRTGNSGRGWHQYATKDKPEWEDILARFKEKEKKPTPPKKGRKKKQQVEKEYKFSSDLKLLELPGELLDIILGDQGINLRDHLALAATCRSLRSCYYTPCEEDFEISSDSRRSTLWSGLIKLRPSPHHEIVYFPPPTVEEQFSVEHVWTNSKVEDVDEMQVLNPDGEGPVYTGKRKRATVDDDDDEYDEDEDVVIRSKEWNEAIEYVHTWRLTKTQAKATYKLKDNEQRNPHGGASAPMNLFLEASVQSLAFRLHGGAHKHQELIEKRNTSAVRAKATRQKNGTSTGGGRRRSYSYHGCG
ncbi:hypothetical protein JCM5350_004904 [Sporobolomyces pararoseus]